MDITMLFYIAIFVFVMMLVGLGLTIREFRQGEPKTQAEQAGPGRKKVTAEIRRDAA